MRLAFSPSWQQLPDRLYQRVQPTPVPAPQLLALNEALALELGLDPAELRTPKGVAVLAGNLVPEGADPLALAYAGHQFGQFVPQLGDGRALLLGEVVDRGGRRRDLQWKGSGRTPYSRGGDGRAALGPVLREFLVSDAVAALGIPTTRVLAAVATGAAVRRDTLLPGAVLMRVAASHLRVGTFQFAAARRDHAALTALVDWALERHFPDRDRSEGPALVLMQAVTEAQAKLVAAWLGVGFVHGVMNTDNTSISGETLDYGPCAFVDGFEPLRCFSSIDHGGRYALGHQPPVVLWNLARLADCLVPLVDDEPAKAAAALDDRLSVFAGHFDAAWSGIQAAKLGLRRWQAEDQPLSDGLFQLMTATRADFTNTFNALSTSLAADSVAPLVAQLGDGDEVQGWWQRWQDRLAAQGDPNPVVLSRLRAANPVVIPRNHQVEAVLAAAHEGDMTPFHRLWRACRRPYDLPDDGTNLSEPPGEAQWRYRTFCGT